MAKKTITKKKLKPYSFSKLRVPGTEQAPKIGSKSKKKIIVAPPALKKARPTSFRPFVFSRHPSHRPLRTMLKHLPFKGVVRFGSQTQSKRTIECNSIVAVRCSSNKRLMKTAFDHGQVKTAQWLNLSQFLTNPIPFPIVVKHIHGSRGEGNYLIKSQQELTAWLPGKTQGNYIVEKFHDYSREYRLHVTEDGCFYTCRKLLKEETPEANRWYRNDSNCTWVVETNPSFDKPVNWNAIEAECVKALKAVGLDVGACDVKVQSATDGKSRRRTNPEFIVIEINSAPSFGEITLQKYLVEIPKILKAKFVEKD